VVSVVWKPLGVVVVVWDPVVMVVVIWEPVVVVVVVWELLGWWLSSMVSEYYILYIKLKKTHLKPKQHV
jgi:hypothetical protein